ncbi:DUF2147 domain-containing protein [Nitrosomonas sp. Nm33]|uniref:DUF2147 domain-containing protein n=1 Tax=Nitrosomonas sp. Nm33 TaxID=133724 RepID=UPI00089BDD4C|nr:DUF2147 domain-containing protein [Nitrosomonas sp. Nm33]SDY11675.1 Uncharacterized conserved protein, DUF2147 family [Nitrosomonas sp. Nm33]
MPYSIVIILLALLTFPAILYADSSKEVTGLWLTKKKDVAVRLEYCNDKSLCGHIAWLNPKESSENPTLCGTKVLWDMRSKKDDPTEWVGGTLYKADEDKYYSANLRLADANTLDLRVYIGIPILGKTKKLTRITESTHPPCHLLAKD